MQWFPVATPNIFLLLHWLAHKDREPSIHCYLTPCWQERRWNQAIPKGIIGKVSAMDQTLSPLSIPKSITWLAHKLHYTQIIRVFKLSNISGDWVRRPETRLHGPSTKFLELSSQWKFMSNTYPLNNILFKAQYIKNIEKQRNFSKNGC